jgi:hypothetical protein
LTRDRAAKARQRWGGVWLCSASERSRCAPDLWASADAAKCDERRANEGSDPSKILLEHSDPSFKNPTAFFASAGCVAVEYRRPGQRGRHPHRAEVPAEPRQRDEATIRARLEAITGPVAKLEVRCWPEEPRPAPADPTILPPPRAPEAIPPHRIEAPGFPPHPGAFLLDDGDVYRVVHERTLPLPAGFLPPGTHGHVTVRHLRRLPPGRPPAGELPSLAG